MTYCLHFFFSSANFLQQNNTNTMPLHDSLHHTVLNNLLVESDIHLNNQIFSKIEPITKSTTHQSVMPWHLPLLGHNITKSLPWHTSLPSHLLLDFVNHFPAFSLVLKFCIKFTATNYSAFIISHASQWQNHPVYWLNPARFYCK